MSTRGCGGGRRAGLGRAEPQHSVLHCNSLAGMKRPSCTVGPQILFGYGIVVVGWPIFCKLVHACNAFTRYFGILTPCADRLGEHMAGGLTLSTRP